MASVLNSPGLVLATAMAVSGTVIFLALLRREKNFPPTHFPANQDSLPAKPILRSCLCSDGRKEERRKKKKKKRVQFADSVKDQTGDGEEYRKKSTAGAAAGIQRRCCRGEIDGIPANRVALYSGILRDRVQRLECSY